jgi:hypothetical protein
MKYKAKRTIALASTVEGAIVLAFALFFLFITRHDVFRTIRFIETYTDRNTECVSNGTKYEYINKCSLRCRVEVQTGAGQGYVMTVVGMSWDVDHESLHEAVNFCNELPIGTVFDCLQSEDMDQVILPTQLDEAKHHLKRLRRYEIASITGCVAGFVVVISAMIGLAVLIVRQGRSDRVKYKELVGRRGRLVIQ